MTARARKFLTLEQCKKLVSKLEAQQRGLRKYKWRRADCKEHPGQFASSLI